MKDSRWPACSASSLRHGRTDENRSAITKRSSSVGQYLRRDTHFESLCFDSGALHRSRSSETGRLCHLRRKGRHSKKCARADFAFVDRAKFHPSEDAAILILDRPMKRKSKSSLASRAHDPKGTARTTAFGFGRMKGMKNGKNLPNSFSSNLRQVSLNTVPNQQCRKAWRGITNINGAKLCIKSSRKRGVCNGDSGGPVYQGRQVGIVP